MTTHSSILAWEIPWTEAPGRLQSMGWQRLRHDWATKHSTHSLAHCTQFLKRKECVARTQPPGSEPSGVLCHSCLIFHCFSGCCWVSINVPLQSFLSFIYFWSLHEAYGILVPWLGIKTVPPAVESLKSHCDNGLPLMNHWRCSF